MLKEYAVEPECLNNWQTFRYLIEQFGVSRGRLISRFPKDWYKRVLNTCSDFTVKQRWQLEIELKRLKKTAIINSGKDFDGAMDWISNALIQFEKRHSFHAVIVKSHEDPPPGVLIADEITHTDPLWKTEHEIRVERTVDDLSGATEGLLKISDRIMFVDKMFEPASERWRDLLARFIALANTDRRKQLILEYHTKIDNDEYGKPENERIQDFQDECRRFLAHLIPEELSLKIVRWDRHHRGDFFHERCILTDKGGIRIDWGLDTGKPGETTLVSLMGDDVWKQSWANFQTGAKTFDFVDEVVVNGTLSEM